MEIKIDLVTSGDNAGNWRAYTCVNNKVVPIRIADSLYELIRMLDDFSQALKKDPILQDWRERRFGTNK